VYLAGHDALQGRKYRIACAMAGVESGLRIAQLQPVSKRKEFLASLIAVEQVEASHHFADRVRTGCEDVFESVMGTARKQQAFHIQSQFVTEIIVDKIAASILHIEILIGPWNGILLGDAGNDMDEVGDGTSLVNRQ